MKIYAVVNGKGGVGKTTLGVGFALVSQSKGLKTLMIDFDQQGNMTSSFLSLSESMKYPNAYDLVKGEEVDPVCIRENLYLLPATNDLQTLDQSPDIDLYFELGENIRKQYNNYDVIIIDTPGTLGTKVTAGLTAADIVFSPTQLDDYSSKGMTQLLKVIRTIKTRFNRNMIIAGVVPNLVGGISSEGIPIQVDERDNYKKLMDNMPEGVLGLVGKRKIIRSCFSNGEWITENDDEGRKASKEVLQYSEKLLEIGGF